MTCASLHARVSLVDSADTPGSDFKIIISYSCSQIQKSYSASNGLFSQQDLIENLYVSEVG
jgi:hypothetical protein